MVSIPKLSLRDILPTFQDRPKEPEPEVPRTPLQIEKDNRIQGNVQRMLDQDRSFSQINDYLKLEGVNLDMDKTPDLPTEEVSVHSLGLSAARGSIRGTFGLASIPFLAADAMNFGVKAIFSEAAQDLESQIGVPNVSATGIVFGAGESLAGLLDVLDPNIDPETGERLTESALANRVTEKIFEFVVPGGLVVKGMTMAGGRLLSKSPETLGFFNRMLVQVAKNPGKVQAYEAGLGASAATAGELTATVIKEGGNPADIEKVGYYRFAAEMTAIVGPVLAQRIGRKLFDMTVRKLAITDAQQIKQAEIKIGEVLNEIMEADPNVIKSLKQIEELEGLIPGLDFTTAQAFQNPQIQSALAQVIKTNPNGATRYLRMLETSRSRVNQFNKEIAPLINASDPNFKSTITKFMDDQFTKITKRVEAVERKAVEEAAIMHPERTPTEIGESGIEQMKILETEAQDIIDNLYKSIDSSLRFDTSSIVNSMRLAKSDPRFAVQNLERQAKGLEPLGLKGREFGDISEDLLDTAALNFSKGQKADVAALMEWRRMVGKEQRLAGLAGDFDTQKRLDFLRKGVDRTFAKAARRTKGGKAGHIFKEANEKWTALNTRFNEAYARLGIQKDISGMVKFAPEDFGRKFIRPETAKSATESARLFKQIFGDTPAARALISDSISYQLTKFKTEGGFNMRAVGNWLTKHEANLRAHGVWDQFKGVGQATIKADQYGKAAILNRRVWEDSMLQAIVKAPNTRNFINSHIKAGTLSKVAGEVKGLKNPPASRGFNRVVWDVVLKNSETGILDTVDQVVRNPDNVLATLLSNRDDLIAGIGREHYRNLLTIGKAIKMSEGTIPTFGARATEVATFPKPDQKAIARVMSKIRASLQGFISPEFTAVQLANQGLDVLNSKAAQNIIQEAMYDWRLAQKLAQAAADRKGQQAFKMIGVAMIPATSGFIEQEDERTDF